jgi:hypothetical protein
LANATIFFNSAPLNAISATAKSSSLNQCALKSGRIVDINLHQNNVLTIHNRTLHNA